MCGRIHMHAPTPPPPPFPPALQCQLLYSQEQYKGSPENRKLLSLLRTATNSEQVGKCYFSYLYDVTLTAQRIAMLQVRGGAGCW